MAGAASASSSSADPITVAFQGEVGAFSEDAVRRYFGDQPVVAVPHVSFEEVFEAVASQRADSALIPIENSLFGSVHANYDLLREYDLTIVGEIKLRIVHHLMGIPGASARDLRRIYSHPQALGQCRDFLRSHLSDAEHIPVYDTAGAAKMVRDTGDPKAAAIASEVAAAVYDLEILNHGIESNHENFTRFIVLARGNGPGIEQVSPGPQTYKTSIVYAMKENVPGALFKSLAVFALRDLDLLKIESRPQVGSPWAYLFYLDVEGGTHEEPVRRALEHLAELTGYLKVLGSYPRGKVIGRETAEHN